MSIKKNYIVLTLEYQRDYSIHPEDAYKWYSHYYTEKAWRQTVYTRQSLIHRLAISRVYGYTNSIEDNLTVSLDTEQTVNSHYIAKISVNKVERVDLNSLENDINIEIDRIVKNIERRKKSRYSHYYVSEYTFRYDPVPNVHRSHYHRGSCYRHKKYHHILDEAFSEYGDYCRKSKKELARELSDWESRCRHKDKSWKTSYKCRKQWMKNQKKHIDTVN